MEHHTPEQIGELQEILRQMSQEPEKETCDEKFQ